MSSGRAPQPTVRVSVFVKLVSVMLGMAISLLFLVFWFFAMLVGPSVTVSNQLLEEFAQAFVASAPDLAEARRVSRRLHVEIRYEPPEAGPEASGDASGEPGGKAGVEAGGDAATNGGSSDASAQAERGWTTIDTLPTSAQLLRNGAGRVVRDRGGREFVYLRQRGNREYFLVRSPSGGAYLFFWDFRKQIYDAHVALFWLTLIVIVGIVLLTYVVLRRMLQPLRGLGDGVARLGDGQLDIVLPHGAPDEFGVLTAGFNQMVGRVREMIRSRDQLLLDVSHELRSPLTRLKVALELPPDDDHRARMAADIAEMEAMIAELLELERLRDGRGLRVSRQDLLPVVRDVAERFQDRAPGVRLVATGAHAIELDIDDDKVRTVLRNLLENAVKYSLPDSRAVEVSAALNGRVAVVRVRDDGPGIPEQDAAHLFEPFFRVDRSRSKKTGGYGLGLSICKRIMEAHGGTIAVEQGAGRGASFILTFPLPGSEGAVHAGPPGCR